MIQILFSRAAHFFFPDNVLFGVKIYAFNIWKLYTIAHFFQVIRLSETIVDFCRFSLILVNFV